jgi:hypothetical protein
MTKTAADIDETRTAIQKKQELTLPVLTILLVLPILTV